MRNVEASQTSHHDEFRASGVPGFDPPDALASKAFTGGTYHLVVYGRTALPPTLLQETERTKHSPGARRIAW